jgi:MFS transporter, Spinster family, sphingosine-1-phosphate transporter
MHAPTVDSADRGLPSALPGARSALILLLAINLFNYIDRQVLAAVEPEIRKELLANHDENGQRFMMGLLASAFLVAYMLTAPVFGYLADRMSRWLLVGIGVILWSVASGASGLDWGVGLSTAFWLLFATRCFVGVGEGAYGPVAPTMISDLYPIRDRGRVLAWFYLAIPVGGALGYAFGEIVKDALNWHWAFFLVLPPGLLLGLLCFLMREPPRGQLDLDEAQLAGDVLPRKATRRDYLNLAKNRSYVLNTLGMAAMTFAIGGLAWWMPDYLDQRQAQGLLGLGPRTTFGAITALSGLLATLSGGMAGDWLRSRFSGSYFLVSGAAMLFGFPMLLCFLWTPFPWAWMFVFLTVFCLFFNTGPTNTILANVTHPAIRASAFAVNILVIHLLGDVISPPVVGFVADHWSMDAGFTIVSLLMLVGGLLWLWGARYLERDTALAPTSLAPVENQLIV